MFQRKSEAELRAELAVVEAELAAHPWNTPEAIQAREITEQYSEHGADRINEELAARGLPSLTENGKTVAKGMWSYGKLERRRQRIQSKLGET
ncbi:hypothetical protein [Microbacterium aurum]